MNTINLNYKVIRLYYTMEEHHRKYNHKCLINIYYQESFIGIKCQKKLNGHKLKEGHIYLNFTLSKVLKQIKRKLKEL